MRSWEDHWRVGEWLDMVVVGEMLQADYSWRMATGSDKIRWTLREYARIMRGISQRHYSNFIFHSTADTRYPCIYLRGELGIQSPVANKNPSSDVAHSCCTSHTAVRQSVDS